MKEDECGYCGKYPGFYLIKVIVKFRKKPEKEMWICGSCRRTLRGNFKYCKDETGIILKPIKAN